MSDRIRYKGRFIKKKTRDKQRKAVTAMCKANSDKRQGGSHNLTDQSPKFVFEGRRIVDMNYIAEHLKCIQCENDIFLEKTVEETRMGLNSILHIMCDQCSAITQVRTGKSHVTSDNRKHADVNTKAVLGAVHCGIGETALNKVFACLNVPSISSNLYKRYEREIGPALEAVAKDSCRKAAEEERELVIENIQQLCQELPKAIVDEIFPFMKTLRPPTDTSPHPGAIEEDALERRKTFDEALGNIVNIIVSYNMGWSKRGNGRSYNSLNGYGTIVGFLNGKVLDFATRNRMCRLCTTGHNKYDHDCRQNFSGSAKAMEPDVGAVLVNESPILKEASLNVRVLIGDEDSSTIAAVRLGNPQSIYKLTDSNHLKKNFMSTLYDLRKDFKDMRNREVIPHLKKCFTYALLQNKGKSTELANSIRNIPDHVFGNHENCGVWCKDSHKIKLENPDLYNKLSEIFGKHADNAPKFSVVASSQANESVNNMMAHKAPKNCCYSLSESADYRVASTVCTKNEGEIHLLNVNKKLNLSPGRHTASLAKRLDSKRKKRLIKSKLLLTKARRNCLAQRKEASRKSMETSEGIQYETNCGMNIGVENPKVVDLQLLVDKLPNLSLLPEDCDIVYFDLETSGFSKNSEILQIAAKFEEFKFSVYLNPCKPIDAEASRVTGLKYIRGKLYFHGKQVLSIPRRDALESFREFLEFPKKPCILVAHNASFDSARLLQLIINNGLIESFQKIAGFSDSLVILKRVLPKRKRGNKMFTLQTLAQDLLKLETTDQFHEALFDVEILEELSHAFIKKEDLCKMCKRYKESVMITILLPTLKDLKGVVSNEIVKKMARAGIHYEVLRKVYLEDGEIGVEQLLSKDTISIKPRVTKAKKVIDKIITYLKSKV